MVTIDTLQQYEKTSLKSIEEQIAAKRNKIKRLRVQQDKFRQSVLLQKRKAEDILNKKLAVQEVKVGTTKDPSKDLARLEEQKKRNRSMKEAHEQSLQQIKQALYLAKLDEYRQMKNVKKQHQQRIQSMKNSLINQNKQRYQSIKRISGKELHNQFVKDKIIQAKRDQILHVSMMMEKQKEKQELLRRLEQEQTQLEKRVNGWSSHNIEAKRQYVAAYNIPHKQFIEKVNPQKISMQYSTDTVKHTERQKDFESWRYEYPRTDLKDSPRFKQILNELKSKQK